MPKYKAVIFDLDGTLLDTLEDIADSMNAVCDKNGFPPHGLEAYKRFIGDGIAQLVARSFPENHRSDEQILQGVEDVRAEYAKRWSCKTRIFPGIDILLDELTAKSTKMCVLSNKPDDFTQKSVSHYLSRWSFDVVYGKFPDIPAKPDPTLALKIMDQLELPSESILYLGDTHTDMETAINAGFTAVGALWGFRDEAELKRSGAAHLIQKPQELLSLIHGDV